MKTASELTDFYYKELYPIIQKLENRREQIVSNLKWYGGMGSAAYIVFLVWLIKELGAMHPFTFVSFFLFSVGITLIYKSVTTGYDKEFKTRIIAPLIHAIEPNLAYNPNIMISQRLFERSSLFMHSIDRFRGNDHVKGTIEGVPIEFSDIHAEYRTKNSKDHSEWHTLFRGLFLVAEFNKNFKAKTVVLPDHAEKAFGPVIGGWLQSKNFQRDDLIRLDDPEFEKRFVVYGNDGIEARYILSHSMMKRIVDFQKKIPFPLFISFVHNHIHVAIGTGKDLLEPALFTSLLDYKQTMEYVTTLQNTIGLVEELKLNEKLWSKV